MTAFRSAALVTATALAALSLSACKKEGVVAKDESVESVAKKVDESGIKPQPGRWESSVKIGKMDLPGLPPQAKEAMSKQMGQVQTFASCLTPEQANKPDAGFFQAGAKDCKYDSFTMAGGKIDAAMTCDRGGQKLKMTMAGTYSETSYDIRVKSEGEVQPGMPMSMEMAIASHRAGECNGTEMTAATPPAK